MDLIGAFIEVARREETLYGAAMAPCSVRPRLQPHRSTSLFVGALLSLLGVPAAADQTPSLGLAPAPAGDRTFVVERADVHGDGLFSGRLLLAYAKEPLVLRNSVDDIDTVVAQQTWMHFQVSYAKLHHLLVFTDLPLVVAESEGQRPRTGTTAEASRGSAALGDMSLGARLALEGEAQGEGSQADLALSVRLFFPTAPDGYSGDSALRAQVAILADRVGDRLFASAGLFFRSRPSEVLPGNLPLRTGSSVGLELAGGTFVDAQKRLAVGTEATLDLTVGGDAELFDPRASTALFLGTAHYRLFGGPIEAGLALGPSIGGGLGSADYRVLLLAGYAPEEPAPPPDKDQDTIADRSDACPDLAGFSADDPILNGCPPAPPDRDGDAIFDDEDACPSLAGPPTGMRRTHGCPPVFDTDHDGVTDNNDACPKIAGPKPPDGDGCPPPKARLTETTIAIDQRITFESGTAVLTPESSPVLSDVVKVLQEHPEITLLTVEGHTDETGTEDLNQHLSKERAERVVQWLVEHGVDAQRVTPQGYGSSRPVADNSSEEGRAQNRRVVFTIQQRAEQAPPTPEVSP